MLGTQERFAPLPVICLITLTAVAWTRQSRREAEGGSHGGTCMGGAGNDTWISQLKFDGRTKQTDA